MIRFELVVCDFYYNILLINFLFDFWNKEKRVSYNVQCTYWIE